jgi:DNA polymerase-3 subunit beta
MQQVKLQKNLLIDALSKVVGSVDKKQINPLLSHCLVKINEKGDIFVVGTDLDIQIEVYKKNNFAPRKEITFTLPAKKIYDFCRALPDNVLLTLEISNTRIGLIGDESRLDFSSFETDRFPFLNEDSSNKTILVLNQKSLKQAIDSIAYSMAISDIRYYLNGMDQI